MALILSSHVAGSRVGGSAQALALAELGIDPVVAPTVLFGRHPGWGAPGGAAVAPDIFAGLLEGIEANGLFGRTDVVITGYFADPDQVRAAARAIDAVRAAPRDGAFNSRPKIVVDPVMGDNGKGLYVKPEVARAVQDELLPRADLLAPNSWELGHITGVEAGTPEEAVKAATLTGRPVLVSSVSSGAEIGVVYADEGEAWLAAHPKIDAQIPNGTGDLLTALFAAALVEGLTPSESLIRAVGGLVETINSAVAWAAPELPIVAMGARLKDVSPTVRLERLS